MKTESDDDGARHAFDIKLGCGHSRSRVGCAGRDERVGAEGRATARRREVRRCLAQLL